MKRINWSDARPGLLVRFRYKGVRTGISRVRECILLDTQHRFTRKDGKSVRLIHAIQINARPVVVGQKQINQKQVQKILETIGEVQLDPDTESFQLMPNLSPPKVMYTKITTALAKIPSPVYRTFDYNRARRNALFVIQDFEFSYSIRRKLLALREGGQMVGTR